jgi:predicted CopG family antitoxin
VPPITIRFDEDLEAWLRLQAAEEDLSVSEIVRRLVAERRQREPKKLTPYEAWEKYFKDDWGSAEREMDPNLAENADQVLRKMFDEKRRRLG